MAPLRNAEENGTSCSTSERTAIDWSQYRMGMDMAPFMFVAQCSDPSNGWSTGELLPYGPLALMPAAQVLNYGQSIFEGMKAYRSPSGRVVLFRPEMNAVRFACGAERMSMPAVPQELYLRAVEAAVRANQDYVPPGSQGCLYVRPLLLGTGALLGLCPAPSYTFVVYCAPVGSRLKDGKLVPLDYSIEEHIHRAAPRGVGATKAAGNYSPCLVAQANARAKGCHDCIYLDAKSDTYLEEGSGCNVFVVQGRKLRTPVAAGSILAGVTRASLLELARHLGLETEEGPISADEAMQADEMFVSGTAVVVQPIGSLSYQGRKKQFVGMAAGEAGPITQQLFSALTDIQYERSADPFGWVWPVPEDAHEAYLPPQVEETPEEAEVLSVQMKMLKRIDSANDVHVNVIAMKGAVAAKSLGGAGINNCPSLASAYRDPNLG